MSREMHDARDQDMAEAIAMLDTCIVAVEAWCRGEATIEQVWTARAAASAASASAASAASASAYASARTKALQDLCVVVRLRIPWPVIQMAAVARGLMEAA